MSDIENNNTIRTCKKCGKKLASDAISDYCANCDAQIAVKIKKIVGGIFAGFGAVLIGIGVYNNYKNGNDQGDGINTDMGSSGTDDNNTDMSNPGTDEKNADTDFKYDPTDTFDFDGVDEFKV